MITHSANKLAVFIPTFSGGGAERAMLNLSHGFAAAGCTVDLVVAQAKGPYRSNVRESVRLIDLQASRLLTSFPALIRYLRRERPAALLSSLDYANVFVIWAHRLAGTPGRVAVNEQNTISLSARNSRRWRQRMVPHLMKRFYPWADFVIGNSQGVVDDLRKVLGGYDRPIHILYNPAVTPNLSEKARAPLNHPWFAANQPPVVLAVGRLTKQKDFPMLIRAFAKVRQTRPARLLILGEGPDRAALEELVKQLGLEADISMPGFVENPYAYMSRAKVFVLSSLWEGLPTVLIEALYCGVPVIATDCPSGPREILRGGQYGRLVPVGDSVSMAEAIELALEDKIPSPGTESWQPYELETVVNQYIDLLLGDNSGG